MRLIEFSVKAIMQSKYIDSWKRSSGLMELNPIGMTWKIPHTINEHTII